MYREMKPQILEVKFQCSLWGLLPFGCFLKRKSSYTITELQIKTVIEYQCANSRSNSIRCW